MRILISNDDGILAPGLAALRACAADLGDVTIVAPDSPQSAAGHAITLSNPLTVQEVHVGDGDSGFDALSVDGRPADCVRLAIRNLMDAPPELVLTGINAGANVGVNVFYSGTVAAAAEAVMCGIPAVAFSAQITGGMVDFSRCGRLCRWVLDGLLAAGLSGGEVVSVNVPELNGEQPKGIRVCRQSTAELDDVYSLEDSRAGERTYRISESYGFGPTGADTDVAYLEAGCITVTPLHVDMTHHGHLPSLGQIDWGPMPHSPD